MRITTRWLTTLSSATSTRSRRSGAPATSADGVGCRHGGARAPSRRRPPAPGSARRAAARAAPAWSGTPRCRRRARPRPSSGPRPTASAAGSPPGPDRRRIARASSQPVHLGHAARPAAPRRSGVPRRRAAARARRRRRRPRPRVTPQAAELLAHQASRPVGMVVHHQHVAPAQHVRGARPRRASRPRPPSATVNQNVLPRPGSLSTPIGPAHQPRRAAWRWPGPGRCRRSGAWSSCRPA